MFCFNFRISRIYSDLKAAFEAADVSADISWWSVNCGTEMPTKWPEFEVNNEQTGHFFTLISWASQGVLKYLHIISPFVVASLVLYLCHVSKCCCKSFSCSFVFILIPAPFSPELLLHYYLPPSPPPP